MPNPPPTLSPRARRSRILFLSLPFFITAYIIIEGFVRKHYGIPKPDSAYWTAAPSLAIGLASAWGIVRLQERRRARKMQGK